MNKASALKLKPGTILFFGDHSEMSMISDSRLGVVKHVTPKGGILVAEHSCCHPHVPLGAETWVPYHHVVQIERRGKDDLNDVVEALAAGASSKGT